ncbi:hypothetical protein ADIS_3477 [Lunatimonas lonarensis]|uniref:Uncharacterized protein n=1 Tax=Lunatimonas lonarensis TaxID=1232681 RepID=R7ZQR1_9BACT|nr:DUF6090 family protein [Lunatimonas lonarensis]EON76349.1 hypothetical protein ADIS_3477 [Lunatimonas lonarensis]
MSRIFRNIRNALLKESQVKRYFLYSIGEIFLVVIGILIALYLNNLNSEKKAERENIRLVTDLEKGLMNNQFLMERFARRVYSQDSLMEAVIQNKVSQESYGRNRMLTELMTPGTQYTWLNDENIMTLLQKERDFSPTYNQLFKLIKSYKSKLDDLDYAVEEMNQLSNWNDQFMAENFDWFSGQGREDQLKRLEYYLSDPFYRNRLSLFRKKFGSQISHITALTALRAAMMGEIKKLKGEAPAEWTAYYQSLGLKPLIPVPCESLPRNWERQYPMFNYYLFYNPTPKDVILMRLRDHSDSWEEYVIKSGEFEILPQFPGRGFMLGTPDKCAQAFIAPQGGFLVIE